MNTIIFGQGRMGAMFSKALANDPTVQSVSARVWLAQLQHQQPNTIPFAESTGQRSPVLWVLAVTDRVIADVVHELVCANCIRSGDRIIHLAGVLSSQVLSEAKSVGAFTGAMHPLIAVASPENPPSVQGKSAMFEGDPECLPFVNALGAKLGLQVFPQENVDRATYHAAAALVASGAVAIAQGASLLFRLAAPKSVTEDALRGFVSSLLRSVAHNVEAVGAFHALASPLMRGDTKTVKHHLLSMEKVPSARKIYVSVLSQVLETLSERALVSEEVVRSAQELLR